jgi:hypothetical protein
MRINGQMREEGRYDAKHRQPDKLPMSCQLRRARKKGCPKARLASLAPTLAVRIIVKSRMRREVVPDGKYWNNVVMSLYLTNN